MAQERKLTRKEKFERSKQSTVVLREEKKKEAGRNNLKLVLGLIVAVAGLLLYIGTVGYEYTLDDYSVIKDNFVVQQGLKGIPTILETSYRYGYWASTDELYRPLSLILFAAEWNFFPDNAAVAHLINVLLYALTGFLLFRLLSRLFKNNYFISFIATILFMAHPTHTEVVASIKSADELLSFLFCILTVNLMLDYAEEKKIKKALRAAFTFFLALLAKENAFTFLAVIPLVLFAYKDFPISKALAAVSPLLAAVALYIACRASALQGVIHTKEINMLDNILVNAPDYFVRLSTAIYVLGRYLLLLVFPVQLSIDYSINEIPLLKFSDYRVLISLAIHAALVTYAIKQIKKGNTLAFSILYYFITIAIVSNIVLIIGTVMADRLLYMPSLGFCIAIAVLLAKAFKAGGEKESALYVFSFIRKYSKPFAAVLVLFALYSFKTIDRLPIWKNNYSLYVSGTTDSPNSSKTHYLFGIELKNTLSENETDTAKKNPIYRQSIEEFKKAIELYPKSFDAYRDMARAYDLLGDTASALKYIDIGLKYNPNDVKALNNKSTILFNAGDYKGAIEILTHVVSIDPHYSDGLRNLGSCYGVIGDYENALVYFFRSLDYERNPKQVPSTYHMIGMTYKYMGNNAMAQTYLAKEKETAPK